MARFKPLNSDQDPQPNVFYGFQHIPSAMIFGGYYDFYKLLQRSHLLEYERNVLRFYAKPCTYANCQIFEFNEKDFRLITFSVQEKTYSNITVLIEPIFNETIFKWRLERP